MRSDDRPISPSTSIRSFSSRRDSDDDEYDSDNTTRYEGLTEEELNEIWERRNLAYFDRRQRLLAEERERQQQQGQQGQQQQGQQQQGGLSGGGDNSMAHSNNSNSGSNNLNGSVGTWSQGSSSSSSSSQSGQQQQQQQQQQQPLTRPPAGFICAADDPTWQEFVSHNVMGITYDPERAQREPAYHNAWVSCERLVNMHRSGATSGNFIPTNPRLAALLEQRRLEVARERYEEREVMRREQQELQQQQQQQQQQAVQAVQGGAVQQNSASQQPSSPFAASSVAAQQAAEYERLNQAHRLQQQQQQLQQSVAAHAGGNNSINLKKSSTTENTREKNLRRRSDTNNSYYMGLPFQHPSQQLIKPVNCGRCNIQLYTFPLAKRFFCQMCGCVSDVPLGEQSVEARLEEKMQDVEDHQADDCQMSYY